VRLHNEREFQKQLDKFRQAAFEEDLWEQKQKAKMMANRGEVEVEHIKESDKIMSTDLWAELTDEDFVEKKEQMGENEGGFYGHEAQKRRKEVEELWEQNEKEKLMTKDLLQALIDEDMKLQKAQKEKAKMMTDNMAAAKSINISDDIVYWC